MLPVVAGRAATTRQILIYSVLLVPTSLLPWALGFAGTIYGAAAVVCGAIFVVLALQLRRSGEADRRAAHRLFVFSISTCSCCSRRCWPINAAIDGHPRSLRVRSDCRGSAQADCLRDRPHRAQFHQLSADEV